MEEKETSQKTITFADIVSLIGFNWIIIAIIMVITTVAGFCYAHYVTPTTYTTSINCMVYIDEKVYPTGTNSEIYRYQLSYGIVKEISSVITTRKYTEYYAERAGEENAKLIAEGNEPTWSEWFDASALSFSYEENSVFITISYSQQSKQDISAQMVFDLNNYIDCCVEKLRDTNDSTIYRNGKYVVIYNCLSVVSDAKGAGSYRGETKIIILGFIAGLVLSAIYILLKYFLDDTIRTKEDIEFVTNTTVLTFVGYEEDTKKKAKGGKK